MFRQLSNLSEQEKEEIAKLAMQLHPVTVASRYSLDACTVYMCVNEYNVAQIAKGEK